MFKKNYEDSLKNITPDKYIKQKIQNRLSYEQSLIEKRENEKAKRNPAVYWRLGFTAVVCCVAIVLGTVILPQNANNTSKTKDVENHKSSTVYQADSLIKTASSYEHIYDLLPKIEKPIYGGVGDFVTEGAVVGSGGTKGEIADDVITSEGEVFNEYTDTQKQDFSTTNTQVKEVDEADVIKTDGKYIYSAYNGDFSIISADEMRLLSKIRLVDYFDSGYEPYYFNGDMFIHKDRVIFINKSFLLKNTTFFVIDISDKSKPKVINEVKQDGTHISSRMIDGTLYLLSRYYVYSPDKNDPTTYIPKVYIEDDYELCHYDSIYCYEEEENTSSCFLTICSYSADDGELESFVSVLGGAEKVYCNTKNIITARENYNSISEKWRSGSTVSRFSIDDGKIQYKTSAIISGYLLNQFSMDEYKGNFRFVTTTYDNKTSSSGLYILNQDLKEIGHIDGIARDERVYSVRFMGDIAYFVTYRETDPLFSVDLSDPENPKILGALKIPGFSTYLHPYNGKLFGLGMHVNQYTNIEGVKISMFNISDPSDVYEESKEFFNGYYGSNALDNHKAILINEQKNIIGFFCRGYHGSNYCVFAYENDEFVLKARLNLYGKNEFNSYDVRALYIDNYLYILDGQSMWVYNMQNNYELIKKVSI